MRRMAVVLSLLVLVGCSGGSGGQPEAAPSEVAQPAPTTVTAPPPVTPAGSAVYIYSALPDAVQGGEIWLGVRNAPAEALGRWSVGLTDSEGQAHVLGKLASRGIDSFMIYVVPETAAPGKGQLWVSPSDSPAAAGTESVPIVILQRYEEFFSDALQVGFEVPRPWRLYDHSESILLQHTWERSATPVELIAISRCPGARCIPEDGQVEKTETLTVGGQPAEQVTLLRVTAGKTRSWYEVHTVVNGVDVMLAYRPPLAPEAQEAYNLVLNSLSFE